MFKLTEAVCSTILDMYSKQAIVAEPAGALSVSALEQYKKQIENKTIVCIVEAAIMILIE